MSRRRIWSTRSREAKSKVYAKIRAKKKAIILAAKNRPCADCVQPYPYYVMDFDHIRGEKKFNLGYYQQHSVAQVIEEITKCDVVCANCHRIREHDRIVEDAEFQTLPPTL